MEEIWETDFREWCELQFEFGYEPDNEEHQLLRQAAQFAWHKGWEAREAAE